MTARYIRLEPLGWFNEISMRAAVMTPRAGVPVVASFEHFVADPRSATAVVDKLDVILTGGASWQSQPPEAAG